MAHPTAEATPPSRFHERLFRPRVLFTLSAMLFVLVLAPYVPSLVPNPASDERYQFDQGNILIPTGHRWVPGDLVKRTFEQSSSDPLLTLLDPRLPETVAARMKSNPWVAKVGRVTALRDGGVRVELSYRMPVAMVETPQGTYPVDAEGVLLPPGDFKPQDADLFPIVQNARSAPPAEPGQVWNDAVVIGAARIAATLEPNGDLERYWKRFGLARIVGPENAHPAADVDSLSFEILTLAGSRIQWGKAPGADTLEPKVEQKIGRMQHYLATYGSFDKPQGPYRIDIRGFDAISLYPLDERTYR
jgi:hypothetical protein